MKEKIVIIVVILLALVGYLMSYINTFRLATLNSSEVIRRSKYGQSISEELNQKRTELSQKIEAVKTNAEKEQYSVEFSKFQSEKEREFTERVTTIVSSIAKKRRLNMVLNSQTSIYSKCDLTDDIIKELDKENAK